MKRILSATVFAAFTAYAGFALASSGGEHAPKMAWSFDGPLGKVDKQSAQRGYQVYKQVCASCHSMNLVAFRNLKEIGFSEGEVKALAAEYKYQDAPDDEGNVNERPGLPSDKFPNPYPNENAGRAANGGAYPPDLSLMIKARVDGANYVHALLNGYAEAPSGAEVPAGKYYNKYFPGHMIAMPPPLTEGLVTYEDGTQATPEQMSRDLVNFLQWAAEPEMEQRKEMGIKAIIFLIIMTIFFYIAKRKAWENVQ